MANQPYNTKWDMIKTREQYIENLKARSQMDEKVYKAHQLYKTTGQISEILDTRTINEKLLDIERLKVSLYNKLLQITDGIEASTILQNIGNNGIVYLSNNFEPIKEYMKKAYSLGVTAPIFIDYVDRYYNKQQETGGVEYGLQESTGRELLLTNREILNNIVTVEDLNDINDYIQKLSQQNTNIGRSLRNNIAELKDAVDILPESITYLNKIDNDIERANMQRYINRIVESLPTKYDIKQESKTLELMINEKDNKGIQETLQKLEILTDINRQLRSEIETLKNITIFQKPSESKSENQFRKLIPLISLDELQSITSTDELVRYGTNIYNGYIKEIYESGAGNKNNINDFSKSVIKKTFTSRRNIDQLKAVIRRMYDFIEQMRDPFPESNKKMSGGSLYSNNIEGVKRVDRFIPFGKYLINKKQLDKNIVAIKRKGGSIVNMLPSQRVSNNVANILRKMISGGNLSYDEINELTDDEKRYLNKVSKLSELDKVMIPTPDKTQEEKLINEFEILKGQILAGNDNPELVKKFKTLILKLAKMELLPKAQVNNLLMDLLNLGH
jgi:hypothetical protein